MFDLKCDQKVCLACTVIRWKGGSKVGGCKKVAIQNVTRGNSEVDTAQEILRGLSW